MDDLQEWISGYVYNSFKYFRNANPKELAQDFLSEYDSDLDFDDIVSEIKWAQEHETCEEHIYY